MTRMQDLTVHEGLAIVRLLVPSWDKDEEISWLCNEYGMNEGGPDDVGIHLDDSDGWGEGSGRDFQLLIPAAEVETLVGFAVEYGYTHVETILVTESMVFGDHDGTVTILRHYEGWVILES